MSMNAANEHRGPLWSSKEEFKETEQYRQVVEGFCVERERKRKEWDEWDSGIASISKTNHDNGTATLVFFDCLQ